MTMCTDFDEFDSY